MFVVENFVVVGKKERAKRNEKIFFHTRMILNERRDREWFLFVSVIKDSFNPCWLSNNIVVFLKNNIQFAVRGIFCLVLPILLLFLLKAHKLKRMH